jgi:hypothetical protein
VHAFTSVWAAVFFLALGTLTITWSWVRLGRQARWGEPRLRVVATRRAGSDVRWGLVLVVCGLFILAGWASHWSPWCLLLGAAWAALVAWNAVAWIRAPAER